LCKLSSEMVSMQSGTSGGSGAGTGTGTTGEGSLDAEDDAIPSASTSATSLVTPRTELVSRRRVSGIHIPRTLVRKFLIAEPSPSIDGINERTAIWRLWYYAPGRRRLTQYSTTCPSISGRRVGYYHLTSHLCSPSSRRAAAHSSTSCTHP
jgi:hypothetical protein